MKKNKLIILASIIVGVLVVTLGLTYASLSFNETGGSSQLVLGDIYMHYNETNQLVLSDAMPMNINDYTTYKVNPVMTSQEVVDNELSRCVDYFQNVQGWDLDVGETFESYCKGTGTEFGYTFQEDLDEWMLNETDYFEYLSTNNIIIEEKETYVVNPIMASQEVVENELTRCVNYFIGIGINDSLDEGSTAESFCKGDGTAGGMTLSNLITTVPEENIQEMLDLNMILQQIENLPYFEFRVDGKNTYTKEDIWYEIVLNHGDGHETRSTRIRDDLLRFTLVEVIDENKTVLVDNKSYSDLTNRRIHVDAIPANTNEEINRTYRLYMWVSSDTVIGNVNQDYTLEEWNDVFASIKVNVTGDFNEKELTYEDIYNVTDESCFTTEEKTIYEHNSYMTEEALATCVTYFTALGFEEYQEEGETIESFCDGTGTITGYPFQHRLYDYQFEVDQLTFLEENNIISSYLGISITDYDESCGSDVTITQTMGEKDVILIEDVSFMFKNLTTVVIPGNIKFIGVNAFANTSIHTLTLLDGIEMISGSAFANNNLGSVIIPNSVTYLGCDAFDDDVVINKNEGLVCTTHGR